MKHLLITLTLMFTLTGCNSLMIEPNHTTTLVEALKDVCGEGKVSVKSTNNKNKSSEESSFKFECSVDSNGVHHEIDESLLRRIN